MNVVVVRGTLAAEPGWFETRAGGRIAGFDLVVTDDDGRAVVPVSWPEPPAWVADLAAGDEVVVRGAVRKRFGRRGGQSRPFTDVVAADAVRASRRSAVQRLLRAASDAVSGP
jgi:hypothetical protein